MRKHHGKKRRAKVVVWHSEVGDFTLVDLKEQSKKRHTYLYLNKANPMH